MKKAIAVLGILGAIASAVYQFLYGFAVFWLNWWVFFITLSNIIELITGIDMTPMYVVFMLLFIVSFLVAYAAGRRD
ncbi:MAG: hypothetical protein J7L47_08810 [Candidatus Odinarchaeota archaeon]|nr:hypothetical protein [Candidatus Odinarchaeota archaeon]